MADAADLLQELGFTEYEARAYIALLGAPDCNGYQVAKVSGIPRANVYSILEKLVGRGAVQRNDTKAGRRYTAMPPGQLLAGLGKRQKDRLAAAGEALADLEVPQAKTPVFNLDGRNELLMQAHELLEGARTNLVVAIQPAQAAVLAPALAAAHDRGVRIRTLCMEACRAECGGCVGTIHRHNLAPGGNTRWLLLVADNRRLIAAEITGGTTRAIATEQPLIVELADAYIRQSLALATMAGALGERFDGLLSEKTQKILDDLHPEGGFFAWLDRMAGEQAA